MMSVREYNALLEFSPQSVTWRWWEKVLDPDQLGLFRDAMPRCAFGLFEDDVNRPLGLLIVRALHELGRVIHPEGVLASNLLEGDGLKVKWSLGTPWGLRDLPVGQVDLLLGGVVVRGDSPARVEEFEDGHGYLSGMRSTRRLEFSWFGGAENYNSLFEPAGDPMTFWGLDGGVLRLVDCGTPRIGPIPKGATKVHLPFPAYGLPDIYAYYDPLERREVRFWAPGTEQGGTLEITALTSLDDLEEAGGVCRTLGDSGAGLRIHLAYVPGWLNAASGFSSDVMLPWSDLEPEEQEELRSQALEVIEV